MYQIEQNTINYAYPYSDVFATSVRLMQSEQPLTFVLVHGSWADASFWNGIGYELTSMGHTVFAPEYPGHGADPNKNVTHEMISHSVAASIASRNLQQIILVGHSFGGSVIQKVTELIPERIRRLVFLDAFVLNDGEMVADEFPAPVKASFQQLRENSKDDTIMLPFSLFRETFVNLASLGLAEKMYSMVSPEPAKPFYEKLDLKVFYSLNMPKSYIFLTEDNVLPQYNSEYGWHPHMSNRLGLFRYIQGHGDHMSTAKTHPVMLAHRIYEAGRD
ncbi:alpha/beta hydrolase [Paenibacillus sp. FSL A5-0031]|uniref:alpha/beta fold hydrolase n=1 Tax=Paenibacillus sp. FSL A5-0031 TaxID=1920420 RepID=UPI00096F85CC|nr:alpha/beta fold hydrolase [Paenibacillus sp. FSL A5-0031]OME88277.1 alpha/beta hydrolase [Paenibacillus sp. FSL A5-0031]